MRGLDTASVDAAGRSPFVAPRVTDQGALSDVTRMFSGGGNNGNHNGQNKNTPKGQANGHKKFGLLGIPGLGADDFDIDTEEV